MSARFPAAGPQSIPRPQTWSIVDAPSWDDPAPDRVRNWLGGLSPVDIDAGAVGGLRPSAVLVPLAFDVSAGADPEVAVLVTQRSSQLRNHAGEVSFPGGRIDRGETATAAAVREAFEEVHLDPAVVDVRGQLAHHQTVVSASHIIPVVAEVPRAVELRPNPAEVDRILWVPLRELTAPGVYHREVWGHDGADWTIHFFDLHDRQQTIWGATARMLVDMLDGIAAEV